MLSDSQVPPKKSICLNFWSKDLKKQLCITSERANYQWNFLSETTYQSTAIPIQGTLIIPRKGNGAQYLETTT